jgi:hypothetical protein
MDRTRRQRLVSSSPAYALCTCLCTIPVGDTCGWTPRNLLITVVKSTLISIQQREKCSNHSEEVGECLGATGLLVLGATGLLVLGATGLLVLGATGLLV